MNNTFYFLRHGQTKVDKDVPISKWVLSETGEAQAKQLVQEGVFKDVDLMFSSTQDKAYKTALPIAESLGKQVTKLEEIVELNRDQGAFMEAEDYEKAIEDCLKHQGESVNNWETADHALERFSNKISDLDSDNENKKILVVGHGFTINLYFAKLLDALDRVCERLNTNNFADWGIVKNQAVVKDIAK